MTDPDAAQRAREWLEHQLAELGQLRNATRRDQNFKAWRQHTLTMIQRIWPGDARRTDRFRRIPFSPPMSRATDRQVREFYERGWGEAGVLLRELLAELNLLGLSQLQAAGASAEAETGAAPLPALSASENAEPQGSAVGAEPAARPVPAARSDSGTDDISRAMERLLSSSPVFRRLVARPAPEPAAPVAKQGAVAAELVRLAGELEVLGLSPTQASAARETLLALARVPMPAAADWTLVREALRHVVATPALARRALPMLLEFVEQAA